MASLQTALGTADSRDGLRIGMLGEQAVLLSLIDETPLMMLHSFSKRATLQFIEAAIDFDDEVLWLDHIERLKKIETELAKTTGIKKLSTITMHLPSLSWAAVAAGRNEAKQRCAIVAIAVERHRKKHGTLPASLIDVDAELFPAGLESLADFIDPFNGKKLNFRVSDNDVTVYSVGRNGKDDGGTIDSERGELPDIGFRLNRSASDTPTR